MNACKQQPFVSNYVCSIPPIGIFLYVAQPIERVLATALENIHIGSSPTFAVFLYIAQPVERLLAADIGNKSMFVRVPLQAYFFL